MMPVATVALTVKALTVRALIVRAGQRASAFPLTEVSEVMRPLPLEPVAGAPDFVVGLSVIRGEAVPVVELAQLLDRASTRSWGRFVALRAGARRVAVAVESVIGVRDLDARSLESLPPLLEDNQLIEAIGADAELLLVLRAARLLPESYWASLAPGNAA